MFIKRFSVSNQNGAPSKTAIIVKSHPTICEKVYQVKDHPLFCFQRLMSSDQPVSWLNSDCSSFVSTSLLCGRTAVAFLGASASSRVTKGSNVSDRSRCARAFADSTTAERTAWLVHSFVDI